MKKQNWTLDEKKHEILKHHDVYVSFWIVVLFHRVSGYTFTFTSYFMSDYHIKTKTKYLPQIILYPRHTKMCMLEKWNLTFQNDYSLNVILSI